MDGAVITVDIFNTEAKRMSTFSSADQGEMSNLDNIRGDNLTFIQYATLEENFFLLDGSRTPLPDDFSKYTNPTGWWSDSMSNAEGIFTTPPKLEITLMGNMVYTAPGITLTFSEDYPLEILVRWLRRNGTVLEQGAYFPDSLEYFCEMHVEGFERVEIIAQRAKPFHYVKLQHIEYGQRRTWGIKPGEVLACSVQREVDPVSAQLPINACSFELAGEEGEYDILNPQGILRYFQQKQVVTIAREEENGTRIPMGVFYMDTWESGDDANGSFTGFSPLGVLSRMDFLGDVYDHKPAREIVAAIMGYSEWEDNAQGMEYELAEELQGKLLSGWIPVCTCREALQQVAFALCAIVEDDLDGRVRIHRIIDGDQSIILRDRKFMDGARERLMELVTGVEVSAHEYALSNENSEVWKGTLPAGIHAIRFSDPAANIGVAPVGPYSANGITIRCTEDEQEVALSGNKYIDSVSIVTVSMPMLAGAQKKVVQVPKATLVGRSNVQEVAQHLREHYAKRVREEFEYIYGGETVGSQIAVEAANGKGFRQAVIQSLNINVDTGIAKSTVVGDDKNIAVLSRKEEPIRK